MAEFTKVCLVGEIPEGEGRAYEVNGQIVAVFNDAGVFRAIDDMCPHMGASLATGFLENSVVACPWHGWRFDTRDGTWCDNRRLQIDSFDVRVEGDAVMVLVPDKKSPGSESAGPAGSIAPPESSTTGSTDNSEENLE